MDAADHEFIPAVIRGYMVDIITDGSYARVGCTDEHDSRFENRTSFSHVARSEALGIGMLVCSHSVGRAVSSEREPRQGPEMNNAG